jgi:transcriptional regulator with PAS, ATPase and Fis domain
MENQLYNTNTFLESVLNSFGVHIFRVDKNFIITYVNNYFAENISKNQSEIIGTSINEIFKTHLAKQYIIDIEDIFSSGVQKISYEDHSSQNCRHKGFVEAIKSPFYDEFGNFNEVQISILAIIR